ncbi:TPA: SdpI family protein [Staphylococcus pseudintermedius]|uniref:SdpI family protein n=1 Tax=Staphylococcus pseudintermedius TaxID=283734 RepID=UPI00111D785A|nr:SdpI family protein [Staphylococcus pseudintermedius]EGQ2820131.1 SdpI family protein [Staphylococcus pseudintermedius]EGQ3405049.1 SdpI family protein [Staphylococcus pseudintermedius]EGQ3525992.1 SdpI family protein [Staphylococcus pseudintermedius]EHD5216381.1 SdpI family protein [Staphylococcus pseudintermedius]EIE3644375.1 SdpI family protein [Staphylococcus pseudintermedius]
MILFSSCLFLFLLAIAFQHNPPQEINYFIGFRTRKSMKNQKNWEIAQVAFAHQLKVISGYTALCSILLCIVDIVLIVLDNDVLFVASMVTQAIVLIGILLAVYLKVNKKIDT